MAPLSEVVPGASYPWMDRSRPLALPDRELTGADLAEVGLDPGDSERVEVVLPAGGERFRPVGAQRGEALRELLRRAGWAPWQRARAPMVYVEGRWVAVIGYGRGEAAS
jgi:hypothetical protein